MRTPLARQDSRMLVRRNTWRMPPAIQPVSSPGALSLSPVTPNMSSMARGSSHGKLTPKLMMSSPLGMPWGSHGKSGSQYMAYFSALEGDGRAYTATLERYLHVCGYVCTCVFEMGDHPPAQSSKGSCVYVCVCMCSCVCMYEMGKCIRQS